MVGKSVAQRGEAINVSCIELVAWQIRRINHSIE